MQNVSLLNWGAQLSHERMSAVWLSEGWLQLLNRLNFLLETIGITLSCILWSRKRHKGKKLN